MHTADLVYAGQGCSLLIPKMESMKDVWAFFPSLPPSFRYQGQLDVRPGNLRHPVCEDLQASRRSEGKGLLARIIIWVACLVSAS